MSSLPNGNEITRMEREAKAIAAAPDREAASALLIHVADMLDTNDHYGRRLRAIRQLLMMRNAEAAVDAEAAGLGRKVAEALEAGGTGLLGETERLIIYRVLRTAALFDPNPVATPAT